MLVMIAIALGLKVVFRSSSSVQAALPPAVPDEETGRAIRRATVQMALYEFDAGQGVEVGGRGLGTVVHQDGERLIVTQDYWTHLNDNLREVEMRDAEGNLLLALPADRFRSVIRYRDGGTLILAAPAELAKIPAAAMGAAPAGETIVWVTRRDAEGGVEVVGAIVEGVATTGGQRRLRLRGANDAAVLPGDSGGGIWRDGRLVANVWSGGVEIRSTWFGRLLGRMTRRTTSLIEGALLPGAPDRQDGQGVDASGAARFTQSTPVTVRPHLPEE